jgi:hypothetical protein
MRKLTAAEVTFEVTTEADECATETDIRGNFASGDPEYEQADREQANEIIERLRRGDESAYCGVVCKATWEYDGRTYEGSDSVWACTLDDDYTAEVVAEEYDLRGQALDDLNRTLERECQRLDSLARKLGLPNRPRRARKAV